MKTIFHTTILCLAWQLFSFSAFALKNEKKTTIRGENVTYTLNGLRMQGYVAYDAAVKGKRPAIIVVHEWWGCNEYAHKRARRLAELGYIAFAADLYGDGKIAQDPKTAAEYATPFYKNAPMAKERIEAAISKMKEFSQTDPTKIAAVGYCFGGSMLLNAAKSGMEVKGVVSFHGGLAGVPATLGSTKAKLLVCHGGADQFVSADDQKHFKENLDSMKVFYLFITYPGATHAFTNPDATATGKKFSMPIEYNAAGDKKSWNDMKAFLKDIFN